MEFMTNIKAFEKTNFGDYASGKMQDSTGDIFQQIKYFPFFNGILLKDVALTTSSKAVVHKLSRNPQGYLITKRNAGIVVYSSDINNKTITLTATGTVTVDIWIY